MNSFALSNKYIMSPAGLAESDLDLIMGSISSHNIDYADLYFQYSKNEFWALEDGAVKNGSFSIDQGVGMRSIAGQKTAFTYSDEISMEALKDGVKIVKSINKDNESKSYPIGEKLIKHSLYQPLNPIESIESTKKIQLLERIEALSKKLNPSIIKVSASLASQFEVVLIKTFQGELVEDVRPLVRLSVSVIIEKNGRREQGSAGGGGRYSLEYFTDAILHEYASEAVNQAVINLDAIPAPAGSMTVVLGSGWPGILLHEAIGHGLEGDFNRKGTSAFSGKMGSKVASTQITVVDDGTIPNRRGSLNIDDEGNPTSKTTLIENGILVGYMQDEMNAHLMNQKVTGNGRRESYAHLPMPRMTNTFMLNGKYEPDEIIKSVNDGIYANNFGGGQVDITSGKFVFSASQAWVIKNGKLSHPIKGASIVGNGPDILNEVSMVGNDMKLDTGVGTCGKEGQSVPVGVGQPTLKIDNIIVGGTG
ncbi:MAG: metalloprotease TldD [Betaproteobacteria bacterium]|nr:metalloprotease TldD [Betaproteobacteria bacterium]MDA7751192.1 metalloprotease TldD [Methylophilaceae bacterium]MDC1281079.1 metalloprotease TldD [Methylophilaceae bacterium]